MYPADWPRCVFCGDFALDGHLTSGRTSCDEAQARNDRLRDHYVQRMADDDDRDD